MSVTHSSRTSVFGVATTSEPNAGVPAPPGRSGCEAARKVLSSPGGVNSKLRIWPPLTSTPTSLTLRRVRPASSPGKAPGPT